ncbi:MAG: L-fuconate dehydratase [Candidatus Omnitrophica bacterium]|nr:L-fuconate dehydratase [Candidatus Omnitrophota bacterium]
MSLRIEECTVKDIRFPTSNALDGSDAMHPDPDYSATYVILKTNAPGLEGHGLTFTCGRGNEICVAAANTLSHLVVGSDLEEICGDMASFWRRITSDGQIRWIGPEKGAVHLATAALINAIWDLWAKREGKPVWKLVADMPSEQIVSLIDFRYITDAITPEEALALLKKMEAGKESRETELKNEGYPAYTTSAGWLGYPEDKIRRLCREAVAEGWNDLKIKVGRDLEDDKRRLAIVREEIGPDRRLMVDANQVWDVEQAISWMKELANFNPWWIEEPTSPDDVLGHARIRKEIAPIGVATGEICQNRVLFKQLLQAQSIDFCQIDSCRLGGVNEVLAVLLMAAKFDVPVCPHAGGVGLCEYVQHLAAIDYLRISGSLENRVVEYVDHLHEHFLDPCVIENARYRLPHQPGYSIEMKEESLRAYEYPNGSYWAP